MIVNIYIQSSIKGPAKRSGIVGFVIEAEGRSDRTITQFGRVSDVAENESYLIALKYALKRLTKPCELVIWMDNTYISSAFEQNWIEKWKENDWKNARGNQVSQNWKETLILLNGRDILFRIKEKHEYKTWLTEEVERRAKKNV